MSMMLMVQAMQAKVGNDKRKLILLKLADNANDAGECFPSYQHIADQCEISRRSAIIHIKELAAQGFLRIIRRRDGKQNYSNLFRLTIQNGVAKRNENIALPSAEIAPPPSEAAALPSEAVAPPPSEAAALPSAAAAPITSQLTSHSFEPVKEPYSASASAKPKKPTFAEQKSLLLAEGIGEGLADDYLAMRSQMRAPLTRTVLDGLQREAALAGLDLAAVLTLCCERGWRGFRAAWLKEAAKLPEKPHNRINKLPKHTKGGAFLAKDIL